MPGLGAAHDMGAVLVAGRRGSGAHTHFVAVIPVDPGADAALVGGDENVVARIDSSGRILFFLVAVVLRLLVVVVAVLALVIVVGHVLVIGGIIIGTTIHKIRHSCH